MTRWLLFSLSLVTANTLGEIGIVTAMSQLGKCYSLSKSNRKVYTLFISDSAKEGFNLGFSISFKREQKYKHFS